LKNITKTVTKTEESLLLLSKNIKIVSNVRKGVDTKSESFKNLKTSINNNGLRSALNVYKDPTDGKYYLIAGHRRLKAIQELENEYNITSEVPVIVSPVPNGDLSTLQLEENLLREDLSFLEEVLAFKGMIDKDSTIKSISEKFGHSPNYVKERLRYSNLVPDLLKPFVFNSDSFDKKAMKDFASNTQQVQKEALTWAVKNSKSKTIAKYVKSHFEEDSVAWNHSFLRFENLVGIKEDKDTLIELCGGEDEFKDLQSTYQTKRQKSMQLFEEFTDDYDGTIGFVKYALVNTSDETMADLYKKLTEVKQVPDLEYGWNDNVKQAGSLCELMITLRKAPKAIESVVGRSNLGSGRVAIKIKSQKKGGTKEKVERTKYYLQTKKFGKATVPSYVDYLYKTWAKSSITEEQVKLVMKDTWNLSLKDISVGSHQAGYNLERIHKLSGSNPATLSFHILQALIHEYVFRCNIKELDKFAKLVKGAISYKEWCLKCWEVEDIKEGMLLAISTTNLRNAFKQTGSKKDIVKYITSKSDVKFPFRDIFTSKEANWKEIEVKSAYLDKKLIYKPIM
tara:strand:- start:7750 stop:9447 length:1698 start_codon:yes stop_codon:yes gene_type:complete